MKAPTISLLSPSKNCPLKKLLIVDDEVDIATSIQYVLNQEGFATLLAHDGINSIRQTHLIVSIARKPAPTDI